MVTQGMHKAKGKISQFSNAIAKYHISELHYLEELSGILRDDIMFSIKKFNSKISAIAFTSMNTLSLRTCSNTHNGMQ